MLYRVCAVRDRAADAFGTPYFVTSVGAAVRAFTDEVNRADEKNTMFQHPDDFDLFELGTYDDQTATFDCGSPRQLILGKDARKA